MTVDDTLLDASRLLADWLPHQRWFAGKTDTVDDVRIASATPLGDGDPTVWHVLVEVSHEGRSDVYQVPLSIRSELVDRLEHVYIGRTPAGHVYDALHDKEATGLLLDRFGRDDEPVGDLSFHTEPGAEVPYGEQSLALPVEQSNTSLAYGDAALLKVFRRIQPGTNPDVEVHDALTRAQSDDIAPLLGWYDGRWLDADGAPREASLAMLQGFLTTATDGWALATASVRDLYAEGDLRADEVGGDFAGEAHRLGLTTAHVHQTMSEVLPTARLDVDDLGALSTIMMRRLDDAVTVVPELGPYVEVLRERYTALRSLTRPMHAQRVHGDYHLGQVLRTVVGWKIVDFEGEPARPLADRIRLDSPLRDVAGMLRSFDYAARHLLVTDYRYDDPMFEQIAYRATEWAARNREAFCDGYASAAGVDPRAESVLLTAYETDKIVYEVVYEARHRPSWLSIPLAAVERLAEDD